MSKILAGRYLVIKTLARGGFSKTYLAHDTHIPSQRVCVVKQFQPLSTNLIHRQSLEKRFQKEAETLEKLSQNNQQIPKLYAYFAIKNDFFLVQEFIEGKTLLEVVQTEKVTADFVIDLLNNLLPVLDFIHNQGIIHRDIKPANIILRNTDNKPVLIDFGAVKELMMIDDSQDSKKSTLVIGTPGYMPSEQVTGQAFYNTDLYALGFVCIFLLTGKHPEEFDRDPQTAKVLWAKFAPNLNPKLKQVIDKAVEYNYRDRYATAKGMLKALNSQYPSIKSSVILTIASITLGSLTLIFAIPKFFNYQNQRANNSPVEKTNLKKDPCPDLRTPQTQIPNNDNHQTWQCFANVANIPEGTWFYGGSTAWNKINETVSPRLRQVIPEFYLTHRKPLNKPPGSGTGISMLLDDNLSFSQSSRPLKASEMEKAKTRGFELQQIPVAIDGIAVIVNHDLNIDGLTVEQIVQIYSGEVTNWQELGGQDLIINPLTPPLGSGATGFLRAQVLGALDLADNVEQIETPRDAIKKVAEETLDASASIYLASAANLIGECSVKPVAIALSPKDNFVKPYQGELPPPNECQQGDIIPNFSAFRNDEYPFVRRLFVVIRQDNTLQEKAGQAYSELLLSDEGQKLIQESGFIAIRSF